MSTSDPIKSIHNAADSSEDLQEDERTNLLAACERIKGKLESPREAALRTVFAPHQAVALRLAIDLKLFDAAASLSKDTSEFRLGDLTSKMAADPLLVTRIMRFLAGMGIFEELGQGVFKSTPVASTYVSGSPLTEAVIHMTSQNEIISTLPSYFEEKGYRNPGDACNGPFQSARNTELHCFEWLATKPRLQRAFNVSMGMSRTIRKQPWFDFFPVEEKLRVESPSDILLVDIGGGIGHDLIAFKQRYPFLSGKLIVQDIPVVIDSIKDLPAEIEAMRHDFFAQQPVKGAKAYYLAHVLHDWPDKQAHMILDNVREAMNAGSILLINESVLPESKVPLYNASADLIMMANFSSLERTRSQFEELLAKSGFDLVRVWTPQDMAPGSGTLLEAVPKKA